MPKIEIQSFFYDLIHCKNKILSVFDKWDKKYDEDERGALVAGIRDCPDAELITLLVNIQISTLTSTFLMMRRMIS